jgi:hypothetical protein
MLLAFGRAEIELIDLLVRQDRTAVSSAMLVVAGMGAGEVTRRAVLAQVSEAAGSAKARGDQCRARRGDLPAREARTRGARDGECGVTLTGAPAKIGSISVNLGNPIVEEVLRFEDLPPGSLASRRAIVRWSDGTEGEAVRFYSDEVLICEGDHGNSRLMSSQGKKSPQTA